MDDNSEITNHTVDPIDSPDLNQPVMNNSTSDNPNQNDDPIQSDQVVQPDPQKPDMTSKDLATEDSPESMVMEKQIPAGYSRSQEMPSPAKPDEADQPWFGHDAIDDLHSRWNTIQIQFIDDPCSSVEQAEALVAETLERVKQMISDQQKSLDVQWLNHDDITTEELRITLRNYRSFLNRLLKL